MKHTPEPWEIDYSLKYYKPCIRHNGIIVAFLADNTANLIDPSNQREEDAANVKLVAAAPELLEALKDAVRWLDGMYSDNPEFALDSMPNNCLSRNEMKAAIAKATGTPI